MNQTHPGSSPPSGKHLMFHRIALKMGVAATLSYYAGQSLSLISGRPDLLNNLWCVLTSLVVIKQILGEQMKPPSTVFLEF